MGLSLNPGGLLTPGGPPAGVWRVGALAHMGKHGGQATCHPFAGITGDDGGEASTWHLGGALSMRIVPCHHSGPRMRNAPLQIGNRVDHHPWELRVLPRAQP